jgi:predicted SAM-dependent methyltransferase
VTRLNVGCGQSPTPGWINYDNSLSARVSGVPLVLSMAERLRLLTNQQREFMRFAQSHDIRYADVVSRIPEADRSVDALYTSHMLEHLDKDDALAFLREARRVLVPGGVLRIAVPDVRYHVDRYVRDGDADGLVARLYMTRERPKTFMQKVLYQIVGDRQHQWMYDGASLCRLVASAGFEAPEIVPAGTTTIPEPGELNLSERSPESVFVEARNP